MEVCYPLSKWLVVAMRSTNGSTPLGHVAATVPSISPAVGSPSGSAGDRIEHGKRPGLPRGFPLARIIERAAAAHGIDPRLLAAVGEQESGMGKSSGYDRTTHIGADGHDHGI